MGVFGIFVKTLTNKSIAIDVEPSTTVEALKATVGQREGLEAPDVRLIWAGKELQNHLTISDYGIQKDSTLFLVMRMKGGAEEKLTRVLDNGTRVSINAKGVKLSPHPCMITFEAEPDDPRAETPCGHAITPGALTGLVRSLIDSGSYKVTCPMIKPGSGVTSKPKACGVEWEYPWIRKVGLLQPDECQKFELRLSLNAANNITGFYAVTCANCKEMMTRENESVIRMQCPYKKCQYVFCVLCNGKWIGKWSDKHCGNVSCDSTTQEFNKMLAQCPTITINFGAKIEGVPKYRICPQAGCRSPVFEHGGDCKNFRCTKCDRKFCFSCLVMADKPKIEPCSLSKKCEVAPRQQI